jgi:FkbM family methyltransferase
VKDLLKSLLPPVLFNVYKKAKDKKIVYYSLNDLDKKIERYLDIDNGFFVELGANDGITQSNTLHFEKFRNWRGILIEPTPHNYLSCRENRSLENYISCCACTSFDYKEKFVEIAYSNLMSSPLGLESDVADPSNHANSGRRFLKPTEDNFIFGAVARPLNDVLKSANAPALMDLLSLDVEGAELEVLKGIDHGAYRFKYMCIECRNIDKLSAYLSQVGYSLVEPLSEQDYLFRHNNTPV